MTFSWLFSYRILNSILSISSPLDFLRWDYDHKHYSNLRLTLTFDLSALFLFLLHTTLPTHNIFHLTKTLRTFSPLHESSTPTHNIQMIIPTLVFLTSDLWDINLYWMSLGYIQASGTQPGHQRRNPVELCIIYCLIMVPHIRELVNNMIFSILCWPRPLTSTQQLNKGFSEITSVFPRLFVPNLMVLSWSSSFQVIVSITE